MMTDLPEFHTFREMCQHLAEGGAAYRYGSRYPIYYGKRAALSWVQTRLDGGSGGEMVKDGAEWSADEQASVNWVFISKDVMEINDEASRQWWQEEMRRRAEQHKAATQAVAEAEDASLPGRLKRMLFDRKTPTP